MRFRIQTPFRGLVFDVNYKLESRFQILTGVLVFQVTLLNLTTYKQTLGLPIFQIESNDHAILAFMGTNI